MNLQFFQNNFKKGYASHSVHFATSEENHLVVDIRTYSGFLSFQLVCVLVYGSAIYHLLVTLVLKGVLRSVITMPLVLYFLHEIDSTILCSQINFKNYPLHFCINLYCHFEGNCIDFCMYESVCVCLRSNSHQLNKCSTTESQLEHTLNPSTALGSIYTLILLIILNHM